MRRVYFSRYSRRLFLMCGLTLCLLAFAGCGAAEERFTWKLWGFETHSFTVDGERIDMRLDTSGYGRYEVDLLDGAICVTRDEEVILEGYFTSAEECADWMAEALTDGSCDVIAYDPEGTPASMVYRYAAEDEAGCVLLLLIDGSGLGAAFDVLESETDEAALDCAHRVQLTKRN